MTKIVERIAILILLALLWAMFWLAFLGAPARALDRERTCDPRTYGFPNSCHTAPVVITRHPLHHRIMGSWHR
jgi:hypothetical protein